MAEHIGCAPKKLDVSAAHLFQSIVGYGFHISLVLVYIICRLDKVHIMEAEILNTELLHYLESGIHLVLCTLHGIVCLVPFIRACAATKLVARCIAKCMPPSHCVLQPILLLSHYHLFGLIVVECHYVLAFWSFERNLSNLWKILFCHSCFSFLGYY